MRDSLPVNAGRRYFAAADVLRILCIFTVAWFHIWQQSWLYPNLTVFGREISFDPLVRSGSPDTISIFSASCGAGTCSWISR